MSMNGPKALPIASVLDQAEPLLRLTQRIRESNARLDAIRSLIPPALLSTLRAGPLDDGHWCLLVSNPAAAAKLRQLVPALQDALIERGWQTTAIKVRLQHRP